MQTNLSSMPPSSDQKENNNAKTQKKYDPNDELFHEGAKPQVHVNKTLLVVLASVLVLFGFTVGIKSYFNNKLSSEINLQEFIPSSISNFTFKAQAVYIDGIAWKIVDGKKTPLYVNDLLKEGDEILTDQNSKLLLEFDDGSVVRISSNSNMIFSKLNPRNNLIENVKGTIFARVVKASNHIFSIRANDILVKSLGTQFLVENEDEVSVQVFESKVEVENKDEVTVQVEQMEKWQESSGEVEKIEVAEIEQDEFLTWSLQEETSITTPTPKPEPTSTPKPNITPKPTETPQTNTQNGSIQLSGSAGDSVVNLSWDVNDVDVSKGFKVVWSKNSGPTYPSRSGDYYHYYGESGKRSDSVGSLESGQTYRFRVCQYLGGSCGVYSNEITVVAPQSSSSSSEDPQTSGEVTSISLSAEKDGNSANLSWVTSGNSSQGFKVVWSQNSGPTYPCRDGDTYHFLSYASASSNTISNLESGKTYHFRVCEYLGGSCGVYSNEINLTF
jgi:FecR-like protein/fibronectin type III domain protein